MRAQVMPLLLLVPQLSMWPPGLPARMMMLGYGDVVVPGLLIAMLRRFDVAVGRRIACGYMLPGLLAYSMGMLLTDLALAYSIFGSKGQPGA